MLYYDFHQLSDKEFESLVNDLLSKELNVYVERYKAGKDKGIDGLFYFGTNKESIIQTKHYLKTGFPGLVSQLKSKEHLKIAKIKPGRYIFATSLPLSPDNKQTIFEIFKPYIKNTSDVFGQDDLNSLLSKYKDIEKNHYKLWLSSVNILESVLHNGITQRSKDYLQAILKKSKLFVKTENFLEATLKLKNERVLLVSGEPGIGKTTLAENVCLHYTAQGYQFNIIDNVREGEDIFKQDINQIFYFDDFLGSNYLDIIEGNDDSHIVRFIQRIKSYKNKLLVLTSRTNILNQGVRVSDHLKNSNLRFHEFSLEIKSLNLYDKALILYNHMWFSNLDTSLLSVLYLKSNYKKVIQHSNFNPRLVEFITDMNYLKNVDSKNYAEFIFDKLENPSKIWSQCYKNQIDPMDRMLILLTVFNGGEIKEDHLISLSSQTKCNTFAR